MRFSVTTFGGRVACATAALSLLAAPGALAHTKSTKKSKSVSISFAAVAGDKALSCGAAISGLGTTKASAKLKDLRFYVSDVALISSAGKAVPVKLAKSSFQLTSGSAAVTLIDLENGKGACAEDGTKATNSQVRGTVPAGSYKGLSYTVGVPSSLNHTDVAGAPSPLNLAAMGWSWQVGRKFLKIETSDPSFLVHVGSTGCTGNAEAGAKVKCTSPNRARVRLASFNPSKQKVAVDLKALLTGSELKSASSDMPMNMAMGKAAMDMSMDFAGCMSGPGEKSCAPLFGALGLGWSNTAGGGKATAKQSVFRAVNR